MAISNPPDSSILTTLRIVILGPSVRTWLTWPPPLLSLDSLEEFFRENEKLRMNIWKGMQWARNHEWHLYDQMPSSGWTSEKGRWTILTRY